MSWILFPLCGFCVSVATVVCGIPTMMAAKSEGMCLYYQLGIFLKTDRIMPH